MLGFIQGLGPTEILVCMGVIVLLFGAKKLPELAKGIGQSMRELRSGLKEMHEEEDEGPRGSQ